MTLIHRDYSKTRQKGNIGEDLACLFLMKRGFKVIERNYLKPWGEIDIVAEKSEKLYFIEVKSVSVEIPEVKPPYGGLTSGGVSRETLDETEESVTHETWELSSQNSVHRIIDCSHTSEGIRPEENMTKDKGRRLERVIKTYLSERRVSRLPAVSLSVQAGERQFQVDLLTVRFDPSSKMAVVERFESVL